MTFAAYLALLSWLLIPAPPRPKLIVVITVDQLRPDYFTRWKSQLTGGLGQLANEGAVFTDGYQDHAVTETAPGHSTILSGMWPAHTGIIRNSEGVQDSLASVPPSSGQLLATTHTFQLECRDRYTLSRLHAKGGLGQVSVALDEELRLATAKP